MRRVLTILLITCLVGIAIATGCAQPEKAKPEKVNLIYGAGSATSGYYVWHVALSRVISKYAPDINLTVVETGASVDDMIGIRDGYFDIAGHVGEFPLGKEAMRGIGTFEGDKPFTDLRYLMIRQVVDHYMVVAADSDIYTFSDLAGKKFNPGYTGSAATTHFQRIVEATGVPVDMWLADWSEAITAFKDGRIVGVNKSCPSGHLDSSLVEVHLTKPLRAIGLTEEQAKQFEEAHPLFAGSMQYIPKGFIDELPESGDFWAFRAVATAGGATPQLSQELGYRLIKTWHEHYDEVVQTFPLVEGFDPIVDLVKTIPKDGELKMHAGAVQYAKELGLDVPDAVIPPEYKE